MTSNRDKEEYIFGTEKDWLCHYTSFDSLCSILSTMTLKVSSYERSNDISEVESNIDMLLDPSIRGKLEQYITRYCGYLSFSHNRIDDKTKFLTPGYRIPSMWGIYADKSRGACLVIDEEKLLDENRDILATSFNKWVDVDYTKRIIQPKLVPLNTPVEEIFKENYIQMLGYKHPSWSHEQERRIVGINMPPTLSLKNGVIRGVVMGCRSTKDDKTRLSKIINDSNLACYGQIDQKQWVYQESLGGNIFTSKEGTYFVN